MNISLVCTVRDEADNIAALLDSMLAQRRVPDEIVINDCNSVDATATIVAAYAAREPRIKLVRGGFNIPSGRNTAVRAAAGPIVACTDAGLTLDPNWLALIVAPIETDRADLVGGFFRPAPHSLWELALGATNYRFPEEIDPRSFLPFGQSMAFRKEVWEAVGGFPEWASHCEDLVFDLAIQRAGYRTAFVPNAQVIFRPRASPRAFVRQYFLYARGDGRAGLWGKRYLLRYGVYGGAIGFVFVTHWARRASQRGNGQRALLARSSAIARYVGPWLAVFGAIGYTRAPYRRLWPQTRGLLLREQVATLALVPVIRVLGDLAKLAGYPVGIALRLRAGRQR